MAKSKRTLTYKQKLKIVKRYDEIRIRKNRVNFTAREKRALTRAYKKLKPLISNRTKFVRLNPDKLEKAHKEGHPTTAQGMFVARPLTEGGKPIKGVRVTINKKGVIRVAKKSRIQFEVGFSPETAQKIVAVKVTLDDLIQDILGRSHELRRYYNRSRTRTIKLVFGQYLGGEDIDGIEQLEKYLNAMNPKSRARLTGIRFVFHTAPVSA